MTVGDTILEIIHIPYCLFLGPIIWLLAMLFTPSVKARLDSGRGSLVFLDGVCINQFDPIQKKQGIDSFETVLLKADEFHVLWSPEYFARLWCIFELAAYISHKGMQSIRVFPVLQDPLILSISAVVWLVAVAHWITYCGITNLVSEEHRAALEYSSYAICSLLLFVPFHLAKTWTQTSRKLLQQLTHFDMAAVDCKEASDMEYIKGRIVAWYGSVDDFCAHVREDLYRKLRSSGALSFQPTYSKSIFVSGQEPVIGTGTVLVMPRHSC